MGASVLAFELEAGRRDGFDLTDPFFTGASLGLDYFADIHFLFLGVGFLALGGEFFFFVAFQLSLFECGLEGFLLKYLPLGAFCQPCA